jgi:integrase
MGRVYKRSGRDGYYADYVDADGKRIRERVANDRRTAELILRHREMERDKIKGGLEKFVSNNLDALEVWRAFKTHLEATGRRPKTIVHYAGLIPDFISIMAQEKVRLSASGVARDQQLPTVLVKDLTPERASIYIQIKRAAEKSPRRINSGIQAVQTMLRWALRQKMIGSNPLKYCDKVEHQPVKLRRPLEDHEIRDLLDKSPVHYRRLWIAFISTGLRKNELVELRWNDVDLVRGLLRVRAETCKVRREDFIPVGPELREVLEDLRPDEPDPEAHVFLNSAGNPWRNNLLTRFKTCVKNASIDPEGLDLHSLRQTYGTILAADPTNDVRTVMSLMRHSTVAMTMNLYAKPRAMRQLAAMQRLDLNTRGASETPDVPEDRQTKSA